VTVTAEQEAPRPADGRPGFSDAVTFSFGDSAAGVYGVARVGLSDGAEAGAVVASGLAMLFAGREPVAVRAAGGLDLAEPSWDAIDAAGVLTTILEPLAAWHVSFAAEDGASGFDLEFRARSAPAEMAPGASAAKAGGMTGYEQLCRVTGTVTVAGGKRTVDCLGQRGHSWGAPDWDRIELARTVSAWFDEDLAVSVTAIRPAGEADHAAEQIAAFLLQAGPEDDVAGAIEVADPRISTEYDTDRRQRRAGLELYVGDEDAHPLRAAGEVACGTSLDLGRLRLDAAFFTWRMAGRTGVGRYDVLRRA
jgi:hypothetical protein